MPELPEVETVRRGLSPALEGRRILRAELRRSDLRWPFPPRMAARLRGAGIISLRRRSKYLLIDLDSGETLIVHLGMSGKMTVSGAGGRAEPGKHDHVILDLEDDVRVIYNDARRFGSMDLWETNALDQHRLLAGIGPEPLGNGFSAEYLAECLAGRKSPVKTALLDQSVVAGLGNIYVCEALWRAGVSPMQQANSVAQDIVPVLFREIRNVLDDAIAAGGSSLKDYRQADGGLGHFQHEFSVYGREGLRCVREGCSGNVERAMQSGRSSFHCPACQMQS